MAAVTPNVVLLTVDALRADHLSAHGYERDTSPTLDSLLAENRWFDTAYSASSHTAEAVPAILTGEYPDVAIDANYRLNRPTLASRLRDRGYDTAGFHSNPYVSRAYGYGSGFDAFDDDLYLGTSKLVALAQRFLDIVRNKHYARAEVINERSLSWIDGRDDAPFFLWNHYMDVHGPYQPPPEYRDRFHGDRAADTDLHALYKRAVADPDSVTAAEYDLLLDFYDGEIRYLDDQIGAFLDALAERDLLSDTIVVLTADHGDGFGEAGYYAHPRRLDDALLRVPLVVASPAGGSGRVSVPTSTLDVVPTVLSAVGDAPSSLPGEPLQDVADSPADYRDRLVYAQVRGDEDDGEGDRRRFRVQDGTDACTVERSLDTNAVSREPDCESERLAEALLEHSRQRVAEHAGVADAADADDPVDVGDDVERRLDALGYK